MPARPWKLRKCLAPGFGVHLCLRRPNRKNRQGKAALHDTAALTGNAFFRCYGDPIDADVAPVAILDVGSYDVNGTLRPYAPAGCRYLGVDQATGPGVDQVLDDPHKAAVPR
jgi:hypothetical protein